jgi:hypothetical protein
MKARPIKLALTLTKVGKTAVKDGGNSSAWNGFFGSKWRRRNWQQTTN